MLYGRVWYKGPYALGNPHVHLLGGVFMGCLRRKLDEACETVFSFARPPFMGSPRELKSDEIIDACRNLAWHPARGHRAHAPNEWERGHGVRRSLKWDAAHWYLCCIYLRRHALPVLSCPHRVRSSPVFLFARDYYYDRSGREGHL